MKTTVLKYTYEDVEFEGFLAIPETAEKPLPAVMVAPAWAGCDDFAKEKAKKLADEGGFVGFALDVYGAGRVGHSVEENTKLMTPLMENRSLLKGRLLAALSALASRPEVDASRIAAMGFCFGGLCVLDLARANAPILGVISIHGLFSKPNWPAVDKIQAKVLVLHGHRDPMVPIDAVVEFEKEMTGSEADWQLHTFGEAMHAFTNPEANDAALGTVYNAAAAERSRRLIKDFLKEVVG